MTVSLTIFKNKFDVKTHKRMDFKSFDEFEKLLYKLATVKIYKKEKANLISPAVYLPDTTRRNVNVTGWAGWCALDIDNWKFEGDLKNELLNRFGDYRFVAYSTASSSHSLPKFRLVFATDGFVDKDRVPAFWAALNQYAGQLGDIQVKDLSRMYYVPGDYRTNSDNYSFIFSSGSNRHIEVSSLIDKFPAPVKQGTSLFDRLPPELQAKLIEHKKAQLENTSANWSSYRNCPYWPKTLEQEYRSITNTGWYHKMYQIMVAVAGRAIDDKYPITPTEIAALCKEFDSETGGWYKDRPLEKEADRALEFVYRSSV